MQNQAITSSPSFNRVPPGTLATVYHLSAARQRLVGSLEIMLITMGYFAVVWLIAPSLETNGLIPFMKWLLVSFFLYLAFFSPALVHQDSMAERGLGRWTSLFIRTDNLAGAAKYYIALTVFGTAAVVGAAWWQNPALFSALSWEALWLKLALNLPNALGQDLLFLTFFLPRLKTICAHAPRSHSRLWIRRRYQPLSASMACATLFAIYHTPNLPLMALVFILGFAMAYIYYHRPNLLLAVLSHAIIGTALHRVLEMHMRIGPFFWESDRYVYRTLFPALRELIGNAF